MKRARLLEIDRLRDEAKSGLGILTADEVWDIVDELLPEAELASIIEAENGELTDAWRQELMARKARLPGRRKGWKERS